MSRLQMLFRSLDFSKKQSSWCSTKSIFFAQILMIQIIVTNQEIEQCLQVLTKNCHQLISIKPM